MVVLGKLSAVVRAWQLTSDLYLISCDGLDVQDKQLLELTSQMTVSSTWGSAAEVQFYAKHVILLRQFPGKEGTKKVRQRQAEFQKESCSCAGEQGLSVDLWLTSLGEAFWGNLKWIKKKELKKTCLSFFIVSV